MLLAYHMRSTLHLSKWDQMTRSLIVTYKASCHRSKQLSSHKVSVPMTNLVNHTDVKISKFHHQRIAEATYLQLKSGGEWPLELMKSQIEILHPCISKPWSNLDVRSINRAKKQHPHKPLENAFLVPQKLGIQTQQHPSCTKCFHLDYSAGYIKTFSVYTSVSLTPLNCDTSIDTLGDILSPLPATIKFDMKLNILSFNQTDFAVDIHRFTCITPTQIICAK